MRPAALVLSAGALVGLLTSAAAAQLADLQPGRNFTAEFNFGAHRTENIDVGDADVDGDLDVITGNGGDGAPQLDRIFINSGAGTFTDETATRFAGMPPDTSRDIEFVDLDADDDLDVFVVNHTNGGGSLGQVSRFYVNLGGRQAGAVGYFTEETDARWGQLLSVPLADQVFGGNAGPFRNWSGDADFADLDDDGDVDLFFSAYGPGMNGSRDSRVFLNDGQGVFDELWPWADRSADTKLHTIDLDLADLDGDFDIDVFMSSRNSQSRVYLNNLYGPLGPESFQDVTQSALYDTGAAQVGGHAYECEYGDVDGDGDFDLWMIGYDGATDRLLRNDGPGPQGVGFTRMDAWIAGDPVTDESEADFGDYDNDGDLDVFVANFFTVTNLLYQSNLAQGRQGGGLYHRTGVASGQSPNPELPSNFNSGSSFDGEWADMDGDGDLDILLANDNNQGNWLFRNILGVPDTHAPDFHRVTEQADKPNGTDTVIHAQIRDNGPGEYLTNAFDWMLVYTVDGGLPQTVALRGQFGSQARGVIPAQTDTTIEYHVEVTDLAGNTGVSGTYAFDQGAPDAWTDVGFGLAGVSGIPVLAGTGPLTAGSAGTLALTNAAPSALCALFVSLSSTPTPFKCGTLVPVPVTLQLFLATNGAGGLPLGWASWPVGLSGASLWFQYAIADGGAVCGTALSNALRADVP
ncbi:MAG TPA: VCBS repeat-containing protein [Planctomycetota bacterium]|nr:VCBS repeat-containing protein [Planctomycetota bacterium]